MILGGLLVAAAAVVVFAAALSAASGHRSSYVVAERALPAGTVIGPGDLSTASLGLSGSTRVAAFRQSAALIGQTTAVAIDPGELIESPMLAPPSGPGLRPVSVAVDADSLASLSAGDSVDVLSVPTSSSDSGSGGTADGQTTVVMRGATLVSIQRDDSGLLGNTAIGSSEVVTLGVTNLDEAVSLVAAAHAGTLELVMAEPGDGTGPGPGGGSGSGSGSGSGGGSGTGSGSSG